MAWTVRHAWLWLRGRARDGRVLHWLVPLAFFCVGLFVYGSDLDVPGRAAFDEIHYLKAARGFANGTWLNPEWGDSRPYNYEHPPLAKYWFMYAIEYGGDEPSSWRSPAVLYGAAGLAGLSVLGRRLFGSHWAGVCAPALLLLDPMWYVHSRMALLEVFVAAPMVWAFAFAVGDRPSDVWWASGMTGLAMAAKFNAVFLVPALFLVLWVRLLRRAAPLRAFAWALFAAALVPFLVYFVSHAPFLYVWAEAKGVGYALSHWGFLFEEGLAWGAAGPQAHAETTPPLYWLIMERPTWYYVHWGPGSGLDQEVRFVYAIGNPVVWWGGIVFAFAVLVGPTVRLVVAVAGAAGPGEHVVRLRAADWRRFRTMGVAAFIFVSGYAAFFLLSRVTFLYYMSLLVPYLALMAGGGLAMLLGRTRGERVATTASGLRTGGEGSPAEGSPLAATSVADGTVPLAMRRAAELGSGGHETAGAAADAPKRTGGSEPPWLLSLFWASRWPERLAAVLFVAVALWVYVLWRPLFTAEPVSRAEVEAAWGLLPWMDRLIEAP